MLADEESGGLLVDVGVLGGPKVVPTIFLVGILVGVPSSLASDNVEPCLDAGLLAGRDVLGVKLDLIGIDVFVVNVDDFDGVRRP